MYSLRMKKTTILYQFTQFSAPDSYKYINKKERKQERKSRVRQGYGVIKTHFCTKELIHIEKGKCQGDVISSENSFSYENIGVHFSMYQGHTKTLRGGLVIWFNTKKRNKENKQQ